MEKSKKIIFGIIATVVMLCVVVVIVVNQGGGVKERDVVVVGTILPQSGETGFYGESAIKAIQLAVSEYNLRNSPVIISANLFLV